MINEDKQRYTDLYTSADLLHEEKYIDDTTYNKIVNNLLRTIIARFAYELKQQRKQQRKQEQNIDERQNIPL